MTALIDRIKKKLAEDRCPKCGKLKHYIIKAENKPRGGNIVEKYKKIAKEKLCNCTDKE